MVRSWVRRTPCEAFVREGGAGAGPNLENAMVKQMPPHRSNFVVLADIILHWQANALSAVGLLGNFGSLRGKEGRFVRCMRVRPHSCPSAELAINEASHLDLCAPPHILHIANDPRYPSMPQSWSEESPPFTKPIISFGKCPRRLARFEGTSQRSSLVIWLGCTGP